MKKRRKHSHPALKITLASSAAAAVLIGLNLFPAVYKTSDKNMAAVASAMDSQTASSTNDSATEAADAAAAQGPQPLDKDLYDKGMLALANIPQITKCIMVNATSSPTSAATSTPTPAASATHGTSSAAANPAQVKSCTTEPAASAWPTKTAYPNAGALLPFNRIVAYYGNFYSTKMGVLGEYPESIMIPKLQAEVEKWKAADPSTPVIPAIDYISSTAQGSAGSDGKYRLRMPEEQIQKAITLADKIGGIVFLDVQTGQSTMQAEIPVLEKYLKLPNVHLALDPEFTMKAGQKPGTVIGSIDGADVNFAAKYLADLVQKNNLPPKILVVHRFTTNMVTNSKSIVPLPEVQVVMDMDGWGSPNHKIAAYKAVIEAYPVQFTGLKLFYKNDLRSPSSGMMTPAQVLKQSPRPIYIQYQ